jgi:hypothetical protein
VTFLLPCGATKTLHVAPGLAVDCLLRLVASAVADSEVAGMPKPWGRRRGAGLLLLRCDGRLLRDGGATLAEAGVTGGSRIEVLRASSGGMPTGSCLPAFLRSSQERRSEQALSALQEKLSLAEASKKELASQVAELQAQAAKQQQQSTANAGTAAAGAGVLRAAHGGMVAQPAASQGERSEFRSVTRSDLEAVIGDSAALLRRGGFTGPVTSHAVQGLFQNAKRKDADGRVLEAYPSDVVAEPFHPQTRWPGRFSGLLPSIVVTYAWAMDLVRELPAFLDEAERMLRLTDEEKKRATWWLDIFFNDQNLRPEQMPNVLGKAKFCYLRAENHMVMLKGGIFGRCWCLMELIYRIQVQPSPPRCCAPLHVPFPDCAPSCRKRC